MKKTHKILKTIGTLLLIVISGCSSGDSESGDFYSKDNSYFLSVQKDEVIWREDMFGVTAKASAGNINFTITQSGKTLEAKLETKDGNRKQLKAIWLKEKNVWVVLQINDSPLNIVLRIKDDWENAEEDEVFLQRESVAMNHTTPTPKKGNPESVNSNIGPNTSGSNYPVYTVYNTAGDTDPYLNVRSQPNANSSLIDKLEDGAKVYVLEKNLGSNKQWYKVQVVATGQVGYASKKWLK